MEMEMEKEKEKQEQNEEHHIDKKQKTENQQDEVVKARRPLKLSRKNTLHPKESLHDLHSFGCSESDLWLNPPACIRSPPYATLYGIEVSRILLQEDRRKLKKSLASPLR
ncbi:uncharacterized protein [Solanum tuberosum]|uniref:uncharacterized protein n=1 Tax=Solanum tuberosum TaxID=4113 RepID=UPI0003D294A6|nr:PREDICTED: uncharacterized protein LOC102588035 [Solanum tuberosum]KAH0707002.1 hypothetical protein KY289_012078 [Solanum tuberosum]